MWGKRNCRTRPSSCPKLRKLRQQLRGKVGDAFNNVAGMLGGRPRDNQDKTKRCSINRSVLNAVLNFTEASKRLMSRVPERPQNVDRGQKIFNAGLHEAKTSFTCNIITVELEIQE
jgi:hypothetical protein